MSNYPIIASACHSSHMRQVRQIKSLFSQFFFGGGGVGVTTVINVNTTINLYFHFLLSDCCKGLWFQDWLSRPLDFYKTLTNNPCNTPGSIELNHLLFLTTPTRGGSRVSVNCSPVLHIPDNIHTPNIRKSFSFICWSLFHGISFSLVSFSTTRVACWYLSLELYHIISTIAQL